MSTKSGLKPPGKRGKSKKKSKKKKTNVLTGADDAVDSFYQTTENNLVPNNVDEKSHDDIAQNIADNNEEPNQTVSLFGIMNADDSDTNISEELSDEIVVNNDIRECNIEEVHVEKLVENVDDDTKAEQNEQRGDKKETDINLNDGNIDDDNNHSDNNDPNNNIDDNTDSKEQNIDEVINDAVNDTNNTEHDSNKEQEQITNINNTDIMDKTDDEQQATDECVVSNISKIDIDDKENNENVEHEPNLKPAFALAKRIPIKSKSKPLPKAPARPLPLRGANSCTSNNEKKDNELNKPIKPAHVSLDSLNEPTVDRTHQSWVISKTPPPPQISSLSPKQLQMKPLTPTSPKPPTPRFDATTLKCLSPQAKRALLKRKESQREIESLNL